jgi:hypothetical protein
MVDSDDEREIAARLEELDRTISELRESLDDEAENSDSPAQRPTAERPTDDTRSFNPPSVGDVLQFTEEYTIPTAIAVLEATIDSLKLLQGLLRVANPSQKTFARETNERSNPVGDQVARASREAISGLERTMDDLQRALANDELPPEEVPAELLREVRQLSEEIQTEVQTPQHSKREPTQEVPDTSRSNDAIEIDVTSPDDDSESRSASESESESVDSSVNVDIDSELDSIKDSVEQYDRHQQNGTTDDAGENDQQ